MGLSSSCSSGSDSSNGKAAQKDGGGLIGQVGEGGAFSISPKSLDLSVDPGGPPPSPVQFTVVNTGGATVQWRDTNPYLGTIDSNGLFTPNGQVGGAGDIEVVVNGKTVASVHISVKVAQVQNGGATSSGGDAGAGGLGGVGGEGFGGPVSDAEKTLLQGPAATDAALALLYPYDQTVFPLDILPPLYQWSKGSNGDFDAVYVHLSAPPYFDYKGFFGRPTQLAAGASFVRHPIPKDVWAAATNSAAGSTLSVELVLASGGKAYGPLKQTYKIALAPFNGRIYYQAYATAFVKNSIDSEGFTKWDGSRFGAATLSIDPGADAPKLVAGKDGPADGSGCRVCHSVSAYGDRMIVQHGDAYNVTSSYDLKNGNTESMPYQPSTVGYAGLSPDGNLGLANSYGVAGQGQGETPGDVKLYDMKTGAVINSPGLNAFATKIGLPAFSPDGKRVAFTFFDGPGAAAIGGSNGHQLVTMSFDPATHTFSQPKKLWDAPADDQRPAFITFMPTSNAVVFMRRWQNNSGEMFSSRNGAQSELWWVDIATGKAAALDTVNGMGPGGKTYLPNVGTNHAQDNRLNYDPSISPVASGGYAWMVFMSRRAYGNVATRDPWESDPRNFDIHGDNPTTKKIWMAAIDLNGTPGTDPSHPAFYIPGQELKGVNSRPFTALSPCISDRGTCVTGVDCCSGFCRDGLCRPQPVDQCSQVDEHCNSASDCCNASAQCIGGFCAIILQ
jgi:hypothetical protein